jgi:hypothetical protein
VVVLVQGGFVNGAGWEGFDTNYKKDAYSSRIRLPVLSVPAIFAWKAICFEGEVPFFQTSAHDRPLLADCVEKALFRDD